MQKHTHTLGEHTSHYVTLCIQADRHSSDAFCEVISKLEVGLTRLFHSGDQETCCFGHVVCTVHDVSRVVGQVLVRRTVTFRFQLLS